MIPYEELVGRLMSWRARHGLPVGHSHAQAAPAPVAAAGYQAGYQAPSQAAEGFVHVGTGEFDMAEEGTMVGGQAAPAEHDLDGEVHEGELDVDADAVIDEEHLT
jgi:hypothetical protein